MTGKCVGRDVKPPGRPCENDSDSLKLGVRHSLLIKIAFAQDQEVASRVVVGRSVASNLGAP